jgi:hypothetical protein
MEPMTRDTKLPRDDEEYRLIAIYEASRAKEHAAAVQLLYPSANLPHGAYMKLVSDLQIIRKDCNEQMLAVRARHNKMQDLLIFTSSLLVKR